MDDDALRTHHVIAALVIGLGFAGVNAMVSPFRRLSKRLASVTPVGRQTPEDRRFTDRIGRPST